MALGPGSVKLEFYFSGAWTDVSTYLMLSQGMQISPAHPPDIYQDVEAGSATFACYAQDGVLWPENPGSPYYPQIVEGLPCRVTGTLGTSTTPRHLGRVRLIEPSISTSVAKGAVVHFTSTDCLADLGGLTLQDRLSENLRYAARTTTYSNGADAWDAWSLGDDVASGEVVSSRHGGNDGTIVYAKSGAGTISFNSTDGGLTAWGPLGLPNLATFEPVSGIGPCLQLPVTPRTAGQFWLAFRTSTVQDATIATGYDSSGTILWRLRQTISGAFIMQNPDGSTANTGLSGTVNNGQWHTFVAYLFGPGLPSTLTSLAIYLDGMGFLTFATNPAALAWITVGGQMAPNLPGKQSLCFTGDVAMLGVAGVSGLGGMEVLSATASRNASQALADLAHYAVDFAPYFLFLAPVTAMQVANFPTQGINALDALRGLIRTVGCQMTVNPLGSGVLFPNVNIRWPEEPAPNLTPAFTVTLYNDDDGELALVRGADNAPTRAVVSSPLAMSTYVGDESTRRQDDAIDTFNVSAADAYAIGGGWVNRPRSSRLTPITVDLATAASGQTLATAVLAAAAMVTTFTVANLPALLGRTTQDQIIVNWTETWGVDSVKFSFQCLPSADWPQGIYDTTDYGLFGASGVLTVTNGNSLGTGTGPLTVASSSGDLMLTGTSITWAWNGEAITGTASGASSPQTLTVTARAQRGTVARTHTNGETLDVWLPSVFGY